MPIITPNQRDTEARITEALATAWNEWLRYEGLPEISADDLLVGEVEMVDGTTEPVLDKHQEYAARAFSSCWDALTSLKHRPNSDYALTWTRKEFPDFDNYQAIRAAMDALPAEFAENSWHNDTSPNLMVSNSDFEVRVWIEYADVKLREGSKKTYAVTVTDADGFDMESLYIECNSVPVLAAALRYICRRCDLSLNWGG